jgi:uncharacterized protein (DUF2132 family)/N-acetylglutamate synthase-like GNAT family acetyltransferase
MDKQKNNPLHGVTLEQILNYLVETKGWEYLGEEVKINCFQSNPSIKSSLTFLRKTPWARSKVESLYLFVKRKEEKKLIAERVKNAAGEIKVFSTEYAVCMTIFDSNTPPFFDPKERNQFKDWLMKKASGELAHPSSSVEHYFVYVLDQTVIACAGYYVTKENPMAVMAWGMVHSSFHDKGIGTLLLNYRMDHILKHHPGLAIRLGTSQYTYRFFEKMGFEVKSITKDGYGVGLDTYEMVSKFYVNVVL